MKKILVVAPDCPYPPNHGGRKDVFTRIELLCSLGYQVELIFTAYEEPEAASLEVLRRLCSQVKWVRRTKLSLFVPFLQSFQVRSRARLRSTELSGSYDLMLLESEYVIAVLDNPTLRAKHVALRVHNNESSYYMALAQAAGNLAKKLYFWSEAAYFQVTRARMFHKADVLYFISYDEYEAVHSAKGRFLPTYVDSARFHPQNDGGAVLFVGNLFTQNNLTGLRWYLEQVHPQLVDNPGYRLVIAGNTRGSVPDFLRGLSDRDPTISFIDSPADLEEVYRSGSVFVNPMLTGAGVKIKTVDAIANGLPVVSTKVGAEGIGLKADESVLIADRPDEFAHHVKHLLSDKQEAKRLFDNAKGFLLANYSRTEQFSEFL